MRANEIRHGAWMANISLKQAPMTAPRPPKTCGDCMVGCIRKDRGFGWATRGLAPWLERIICLDEGSNNRATRKDPLCPHFFALRLRLYAS